MYGYDLTTIQTQRTFETFTQIIMIIHCSQRLRLLFTNDALLPQCKLSFKFLVHQRYNSTKNEKFKKFLTSVRYINSKMRLGPVFHCHFVCPWHCPKTHRATSVPNFLSELLSLSCGTFKVCTKMTYYRITL